MAVLALMGCAIWCSGSALSAQDTAAEQQLKRLRQVMLRWTQGNAPQPDEVRAVFVADYDPRAKGETECPKRVEADLGTYLSEREPGLLLPLAFWHVQMLFGTIEWTQSPYVREVDIERAFDRLAAYRARVTRGADALSRDQADHRAVLAWIGVAELFARLGSPEFNLRADRAIGKAIAIDGNATFARYWSAFLSERLLNKSLDRMRLWLDLAEAHPDRPEYRLRFAVAARRAERETQARDALERVARGDGDSWIRILAYEEWVQSLLAGNKQDQKLAGDILHEARQALPGSPGLDLLASFLLLESRQQEALRLAEQIEAHNWGPNQTSPRLQFELPNEQEVGPARRELVELLSSGRQHLAAQLQALDPANVLSRRSHKACRHGNGT